MSTPALPLEFRPHLSPSSHDLTIPADADLIHHCIAGDERAWAELVHRYKWLVYSVPRRAGLSQADSEDVMQNVFRVLFQKLPTLRDRSRLSAWLVTCARNETIDFVRRWHPASALADDLVEGDGNLHRVEQRDLLLKAVGRLCGNEKTIVSALLEEPDVSDVELALKTGLKPDSVRTVKARALGKLRETLGEMGWRL